MKRRHVPLVTLSLLAVALLLTPSNGPRAQELAAVAPTTFAALEQEIAREINHARTRPAEYAAFIEQLRPLYSGREYRRPGRPALLTEEGVGALDEAVEHLRSARPAAALEVSDGMCAGAAALVRDQAGSARTGHKGMDGSLCEQRVGRFGAWQEPIGENLSYGAETARERVIALLIDDGFANRGHRQRLLNPAFKVIGVACGGHQLGAVCVVTLAGGFTNKPAAGQRPAPAQAPAGTRKL
jgi:uncharacterized protein YkwD